jgi:electron transfer flavoprotein alpha subunit
MEEGYPRILDDCRLCGECVYVCPERAISIKEVVKEADLSDYRGVLVFAEQRIGKVHPVAYELLGKGRELADNLGEDLYAVLIGSDIQNATSNERSRQGIRFRRSGPKRFQG